MTHIPRGHSFTSEDHDSIFKRISEHDNLELQTFQYTDHSSQDVEHDIDPDNNFFTSFDSDCCYYTSEQFNKINRISNLSVIHINSRSLYANFTNIKDYLDQFLHPFSIIAISETWITKDKSLDFE